MGLGARTPTTAPRAVVERASRATPASLVVLPDIISYAQRPKVKITPPREEEQDDQMIVLPTSPRGPLSELMRSFLLRPGGSGSEALGVPSAALPVGDHVLGRSSATRPRGAVNAADSSYLASRSGLRCLFLATTR